MAVSGIQSQTATPRYPCVDKKKKKKQQQQQIIDKRGIRVQKKTGRGRVECWDVVEGTGESQVGLCECLSYFVLLCAAVGHSGGG